MTNSVRLGLMVPANNTTMEPEMLDWLPEGSLCKTLRVPRGDGLLTPESLPAYKKAAVELAAAFTEAPVDVIAYGCTAAGFILGPEGDAAIAKDLAAITGRPVVTTARAMLDALREIGARRIALLTPYQDDVNMRIRRFLESGDISVDHLDSFHAADVSALGRITEDEVEQRARAMIEADCDALFIACSQLPTFHILDSLQSAFGKPVLSSIQSTAQYVMRHAASRPSA
jgi:maleate cis-trans isomerase